MWLGLGLTLLTGRHLFSFIAVSQAPITAPKTQHSTGYPQKQPIKHPVRAHEQTGLTKPELSKNCSSAVKFLRTPPLLPDT